METTTHIAPAGKSGDEIEVNEAHNLRTLTRTRMDLATLEARVEHYPEPIRSAVIWVQHYWADTLRGNGEALRVIGEKLRFDKSDSYFSNLIKGYYFQTEQTKWKEGGAAWSEFLQFFEDLKRYALQAERTGKLPFVLTPTYRLTEAYIQGVRALNAVCKIGGISGPTGSQKTAILKYYAQIYNHGATTLVQAVSNARLAALQRKIAERFRAGNSALERSGERDSLIRANLNDTRTLIIDNVQRLYVDGAGSKQPAFNWLLEVQEDTDCTLILCFTTDFTDTLHAARARGYFEQFVGRMGGFGNVLKFPDYTPDSDLRCIAREFGLEAGKSAMAYLQAWSREAGRIRIVFHRLQVAQAYAKAAGRTRITLADLEDAKEYCPCAIGTDSDDEGGAE